MGDQSVLELVDSLLNMRLLLKDRIGCLETNLKTKNLLSRG